LYVSGTIPFGKQTLVFITNHIESIVTRNRIMDTFSRLDIGHPIAFWYIISGVLFIRTSPRFAPTPQRIEDSKRFVPENVLIMITWYASTSLFRRSVTVSRALFVVIDWLVTVRPR